MTTVRSPQFPLTIAVCAMVSSISGCTADAPPLAGCELGFHAAGLDCVANVSGDECAGVTCSGHGTCVVVVSEPNYPLCLCDEEYYAERQTNCLADGEFVPSPGYDPGSASREGEVLPREALPSEGCLSTSDCGDAEVCQLETGLCVAENPNICSKDTSSDGLAFLGAPCSSSQCAAGLVCVHHSLVMDATTGEWVPVDSGNATLTTGHCAEACNPCENNSCGEGECIARLHGDGGFCSPQPLLRERELCAIEAWVVGWCEAGTICARDSRWIGDRFGRGHASSCQRYCTPDRPECWDDAYFWEALASADCSPSEICTLRRDSTPGRTFLCVPGSEQGVGESCGDFMHPEDVCLYPLECTNNNIPPIFVPGTCNHQDGIDCASPSACPAGTFCRFGDNPDHDDACIAPGAVAYNGLCEEDDDCASGLHCASDRPGTCDHGNKCCVL